jgi:uncharacterized protein YndB with AHSA1/START domain
MSMNGYVAETTIVIHAPAARVWHCLTDPELVKQVMFGSEVKTDWKEGSEIIYSGIWEGKPFEDKGKVVQIVPEKEMVTTHFSPLSGKEDIPENYQTVTYELAEVDGKTTVTLTQDNNPDEAARDESVKNWKMTLESLKRVAEAI